MISKISSVNIKEFNFSKQNTLEKTKTQNYSASKPLNLNLSAFLNANKASINFGVMKKSQFSGIDLMMVEQLKAPIEKMSKNEDFQKYCQNILDEKYLGEENIKKLSESVDLQAQIQKEAILTEWSNYVDKENDAYTPAIKLMILSSITRDLVKTSNHLPPNLDKRKVADTMYEIEENSKKYKHYQCNFDKLYRNNLQIATLETETHLDESLSGWVIIPSEKNDPQNFEENVKKLQTLSHNSWCTKTYNAKPYLAEGDFHIYLEKGQSRLGIRFDCDEIQEIQGARNNTTIPLSYFDIAKEHVEECKYKLNYRSQEELKKAEEAKQEVEKIKTDLADSIKNRDYQKVLEYFRIEVIEKDENGLMVVSELHEPNKKSGIDFKDIDIDINDLLKQVKKVNGYLDLRGDETLKSTGSLEEIGKNADFRGCSNLKEFPCLSKFETIYGLTPEQKHILGKPMIEKFKKDLAEPIKNKDYQKILEYFGVKVQKDVNAMLTVSELKEPNKELNIMFSDIDADINDLLKQVKKVDGEVDLRNDKSLKSTGALEEVNGDVVIWDCFNLKEFPKLKKWKMLCGITTEQRKILYKYIADKIKADLAEPIKKKDYQKILEYFGVKILETDKNGLMTVSELKEPDSEHCISFNDVGIDINDLLKRIKKVDGNLNLKNDFHITSTGSLEEVTEDAIFTNCKNLKEISKLKKVGSKFDVGNCHSLTSTGSLEECDVLNLSNIDKGQDILENLNEFPNLKTVKYVTTRSKTQKKIINRPFVKKIQNELSEAIKQKNYQKILEYFGAKVQKDENGLMTLSELRKPNLGLEISFNDIGVDINDLLKQVKKVNGWVDLRDEKSLTSTWSLEEVNGLLVLERCSNLKEFPNLKKVGPISAEYKLKNLIERQIEINNLK